MSGVRLRPPRADECVALTELCLRSKAHWAYDESFMAACREELTVTATDLKDNFCLVADKGTPIGFLQVSIDGDDACLEKLFVEPTAIGQGIGRQLLDSAISYLRKKAAIALVIEADPDAAQFYRKYGAKDLREVESGSIPGRKIPQLVINLGVDPMLAGP
ncbi:hypothetical protein BPTFM16_00579 [Altererythrobacter insulae]|nr:hypothetical protein BPTFM16_00579 [Altererythrobacter insulae]